jgi:MFS family permease
MEDFQTSQTLAAFSVSVFLLGFGSGPLVLAPLSETFGRKPIYIVGFTIFTLTQIPCALSKSISMLIGFRFLQGFFGSASIANGGGTISDMYDALERTRVVGWYILGPLTGTNRLRRWLNFRSCCWSHYWWVHDGVIIVEMDVLVDVNIELHQHHHLHSLPS